MKLNYITTIDISKNNIFYSIINYKDKFFVFRRKDWRSEIRQIEQLFLSENFNLKNDTEIITYRGEDPRCFIHNNKLYVVDNYHSDIHLIDIDTNLYLKIWVNGKNLSFISHNNNLYFIFRMKPFILCEVSLQNGKVRNVETIKTDEIDHSYRGGTPGYKKNDNIYYGFGHKTYFMDKQLIHDIFLWEIDFNGTPKIKIIDIEQPSNSKTICDPTSIIKIDNKSYLITAESDKPWFEEQDYITNIYEINHPSTF